MKYRIAKRNDEYWPHVWKPTFFGFGKWKKIGTHPDGFGLYSLPNTSNPKSSINECERTIEKFELWYLKKHSDIKTTYTYVQY